MKRRDLLKGLAALPVIGLPVELVAKTEMAATPTAMSLEEWARKHALPDTPWIDPRKVSSSVFNLADPAPGYAEYQRHMLEQVAKGVGVPYDELISHGIKSRSQVLRENGFDPVMVDKEIRFEATDKLLADYQESERIRARIDAAVALRRQ